MTTTATTTPQAVRRAGAPYLALAPAILVIARLITTPISNKPRDFVADVHDSAAQTEAGAALAIVATALLAWTLVLLARSAMAGSRRVAVAAGVLTTAGCVGMVLVSALQAIGARLSVQDLGDKQGADLFDAIYNTGALPVVAQLFIVAGVIGSICLGVALYKREGLGRPAAIVTGVGSLLVFATAPGPIQPFLVVAAAVAALGYYLVGASSD